MIPLVAAFAPLLAFAQSVEDPSQPAVIATTKAILNGTVEYTSFCKTCPYNICTHTEAPWGGEVYQLTCWGNGDVVGDTGIWVKTTTGCWLAEYDLVEYEGDYVAELEYCAITPLEITQEPAEIKYLSECKWGYYTADESIKYYGRDVDVTVTCWAEGGTVMDDHYWYKTMDNCLVSGSGLWANPDRDSLQWCGPDFGPRINESEVAVVEKAPAEGLTRRWLQPEQIGEEYASCYTCPSAVKSSKCGVETIYEFNQTVVSQCVYWDDTDTFWMYTTDWCWVNSNDFWVPPYDNYRYPSCDNWGLPEGVSTS